MTFDEFKEQNSQYWLDHPELCAAARIVWDAATAAERQRCREIAEEHERYASVIGRDVANSIAEEIGE